MTGPSIPVVAEFTLIDAVQVSFIVLAVERKVVTKSHACNVLGMTPQEFDAWRKQASDMGRAFSFKLADARRGERR